MDVGAWLSGLGLGEYAEAFAANHVDGVVGQFEIGCARYLRATRLDIPALARLCALADLLEPLLQILLVHHREHLDCRLHLAEERFGDCWEL